MEEEISLSDGSSFSGFSEDDMPKPKVRSEVSKPPPTLTGKGKSSKASKVVKKTGKTSTKTVQKPSGVSSDKSKPFTSSDKGNDKSEKKSLSADKDATCKIDFSSISSADLEQLRTVLGISQNEPEFVPDYEEDDIYFGRSLEDRPSLTVERNADDISDTENVPQVSKGEDINNKLMNAMFGEDDISENVEDDEWELPKMKAPEKGKPVANSLAKMINLACTSSCDIEKLLQQYKVPENCDRATPPTVNQEIWKTLDKKSHWQDKVLVDIQNLVATGLAPIIKLAEVLKGQMVVNKEVKTLLTDALTIFGQAQYQLSVRRRYLIRPNLKKKYEALCHVTMPITSKLFGDDISKDIKNCDSQTFLGKDSYSYPRGNYGGRPFPGRGRFPRRSYAGRFQPYPQIGQQYRQFPSRNRPMMGSRRTATVTSASLGPNGRE